MTISYSVAAPAFPVPGKGKVQKTHAANSKKVEAELTLARCFFAVPVRPDNSASEATGWADAHIAFSMQGPSCTVRPLPYFDLFSA